LLLSIEVADTTLEEDRGEKAQLCAEAAIADYWLVNLLERCIEVFRHPVGGDYRQIRKHSGDDSLRPLRFPDVMLRAASVFDR
jgi:Uma2 family endonuclease